MLKYALINDNKVENIAIVENSDFVENLKCQYQLVKLVNDDVSIGSIWNGSEFLKNPNQIKFENESICEILKEKNPDSLSEQEKEFLKKWAGTKAG